MKNNNYYKTISRNLFKCKSFVIPLIILTLLFITSLLIYIINGASVNMDIDNALISPNTSYLFGTNQYGQNFFYVVMISVFNTILFSAFISISSLLLAIMLGIIWGNSSKLDYIMIFIKSIIDNIPSIFFYIIIVSSLGSGMISLLLIIILFNWINTACLIRNNLIIVRNRDYNQVSKLLKAPFHKIAINNYLPSLLPIIFNSFAVSFPQIISLEITLSYFGLNLINESLSIGTILYESIYNNYCFSHLYLFLIPLCFLPI